MQTKTRYLNANADKYYCGFHTLCSYPFYSIYVLLNSGILLTAWFRCTIFERRIQKFRHTLPHGIPSNILLSWPFRWPEFVYSLQSAISQPQSMRKVWMFIAQRAFLVLFTYATVIKCNAAVPYNLALEFSSTYKGFSTSITSAQLRMQGLCFK